MGNRAVITASTAAEIKNSDDIGIYLHWNGGRDSVEAFLTYCALKGYRPPDMDNYGWARLCQVIGNYIGGGLSLGIDKCSCLACDNYDNGVYIIKGWRIVGRQYNPEMEQSGYDLIEMLYDIDGCQPERQQLWAHDDKGLTAEMREKIENAVKIIRETKKDYPLF